MKVTKEIWKDVVGFEGLYKISSVGKILGVKRNKVLKSWKHRCGYMICKLYKSGKSKCLSVHRLVAEAFIPNPENKPQVNHINTIKHDNRLKNLEWCNNSENQIHAVKNGLKRIIKGKHHHYSKPIEQRSLDGKIIKKWESMRSVQTELGLYSANISLCCHGQLKTAYGFKWKFI